MSTGDLKNNISILESELKAIKSNLILNITRYLIINKSISQGLPTAFLPIIQYVFLEYSSLISQHLATKGYVLFGKSDSRFIQAVYTILRDEFNYKPKISRDQFFLKGFAERKCIFVCDIIRFCKGLLGQLKRTHAKHETTRPHTSHAPLGRVDIKSPVNQKAASSIYNEIPDYPVPQPTELFEPLPMEDSFIDQAIPSIQDVQGYDTEKYAFNDNNYSVYQDYEHVSNLDNIDERFEYMGNQINVNTNNQDFGTYQEYVHQDSFDYGENVSAYSASRFTPKPFDEQPILLANNASINLKNTSMSITPNQSFSVLQINKDMNEPSKEARAINILDKEYLDYESGKRLQDQIDQLKNENVDLVNELSSVRQRVSELESIIKKLLSEPSPSKNLSTSTNPALLSSISSKDGIMHSNITSNAKTTGIIPVSANSPDRKLSPDRKPASCDEHIKSVKSQIQRVKLLLESAKRGF